MKVLANQNFSVPASSFAIMPLDTDGTLYYSVDGEHITESEHNLTNNQTLVISLAPRGLYWRASCDCLIQY